MTATVETGPDLRHATDLRDALRMLGEPGAVPVAGGVGLTLRRHAAGTLPHSRLVAIGGLPELRGIEVTDDLVRIGAAETLHTLAVHPVLAPAWPILSEACGSVATERIRRCVTLGGNIAPADPAHDPPVALAAMDASVVVAGAGEERRVPVTELPVADGELVTAVELARPPAGTGSAFQKYLVRGVWEYACVAAGAVVRLDGTGAVAALRVALGSVGRAALVVDTTDLVGRQFDGALADAVAARAREVAEPVSDVRGSADYKREMTARFTDLAVRKAAERAEGSRT